MASRDYTSSFYIGGKWLPARDVSEAVPWLASDQAWHVTGIVLPIDAGQLAKLGCRTASAVAPGFAARDGPVVNLVRAVEDPHGTRRRVQFGQHEVLGDAAAAVRL